MRAMSELFARMQYAQERADYEAATYGTAFPPFYVWVALRLIHQRRVA